MVEIILEIIESTGNKKTIKANISQIDSIKPLTEKGIETYKTSFTIDRSSVEKIWYVNDYNLIKEHIVLELQKLISEIDPDKNKIVVLKDTQGLFQLKDGYCQHCQKKFIQYFGCCYGTIKKCRYCKKLTVVKDKKLDV